MNIIPRKEIGYLPESPGSGDVMVCREIRAAMSGKGINYDRPKRGNLEDFLC